jgi:hypothetical protein
MADTVSIQTYISDMIAVEHEVIHPIEKQLELDDVKLLPDVETLLENIHRVLHRHIDTLEQHLESVGGHPASGLKAAVGDVLGNLGTTVQNIRSTKVSKSLRDDYTALSLTAVAYEMLYTSSLATRSESTAKIALEHLNDITGFITKLTGLLADVVTKELLDIDPTLDSSYVVEAKQQIRKAWESKPSPV